MSEREGGNPAFQTQDRVTEMQEKPGHITDVLRSVKGQIWEYVNKRWPAFSESGEGLGEVVSQDFLSLLIPAALGVELSQAQRVFLRVALCEAVTFKKNRVYDPDIDRNKILGVATYLNTLALLKLR